MAVHRAGMRHDRTSIDSARDLTAKKRSAKQPKGNKGNRKIPGCGKPRKK